MIVRYDGRQVSLPDNVLKMAESLAANPGWWVNGFRYRDRDAEPPTVERIKSVLDSQDFQWLSDDQRGALATLIRKVHRRAQAKRRHLKAEQTEAAKERRLQDMKQQRQEEKRQVKQLQEKQRLENEELVQKEGAEKDADGQLVKATLDETPRRKKRFGKLGPLLRDLPQGLRRT